jgi:hypothetical protein
MGREVERKVRSEVGKEVRVDDEVVPDEDDWSC